MNRELLFGFPIGLAFAVVLLAAARSGDSDSIPVTPAADSEPATRIYLDHVPIAVRDLDEATLWWRERLGFSIKPGRLHANTINNSHMKFADGTEIELITAEESADPLAARYRQLIERGDGGAFLALRPEGIEKIAELLSETGPDFEQTAGSYFESLDFGTQTPLDYLFFITLTSLPVDLPEHVTHANTGTSLFAVWLSKEDFSAEEQLLEALGVLIHRNTIELNGGIRADDVVLDRGHLYLIKRVSPAGADRPVVGLTVAAADVDVAATVLRGLGLLPTTGRDLRGRYARVEPERANGVWLEFLEPHRHE